MSWVELALERRFQPVEGAAETEASTGSTRREPCQAGRGAERSGAAGGREDRAQTVGVMMVTDYGVVFKGGIRVRTQGTEVPGARL